MRVTIIGGEKSLVDGNWNRRLRAAGLILDSHITDMGRAKFMPIPASSDGVIVIRDMARHGMSDSAKAECAQRGILYAAVPRKWSQAAPILRMQGFLAAENAPSTTADTGMDKDLQRLAVRALQDEWDQGRAPQWPQVNVDLFGIEGYLTEQEFREVQTLAAQERDAVLSNGRKIPEIREWAEMLFAGNPGLVLTPEAAQEQILDVLEWKPDINVMSEGVGQAIVNVKRAWESSPAVKTEAMKLWLTNWWTAWKKNEAPLPRRSEITRLSRKLFDSSPNLTELSECRAKALGEWARDLIELGPAQTYLDKQVQNVGPSLDCPFSVLDLLTKGFLQGLEIKPENVTRRGRWYTSEYAITQLINNGDWDAIRAAAAPPDEPVVEEIPEVEVSAPEPEAPEPEAPEPEAMVSAPVVEAKPKVTIRRKLRQRQPCFGCGGEIANDTFGAFCDQCNQWRNKASEETQPMVLETPAPVVPSFDMEGLVAQIAGLLAPLTAGIDECKARLSALEAKPTFEPTDLSGISDQLRTLTRDVGTLVSRQPPRNTPAPAPAPATVGFAEGFLAVVKAAREQQCEFSIRPAPATTR